MNKNLFSRTAATSFVLGLAMAASAQQANFLSNNHCIYRVDNSQKVLLLPVQEKAESIPAIGSTIPDNTPYTKALSFELPVLCNGMDMIAPSGKFCMAIPIASERAAALVMVVVPDIQLA